MVMIRYGGGIIEKNGKEGDVIYRRDWCMNHQQQMPRWIDREASPLQRKRRDAWRYLTGLKKIFGTREWVDAWIDYSRKIRKHNKKGEAIILTWWAVFLSHNLNKEIAGEPIDWMPPGYKPIEE